MLTSPRHILKSSYHNIFFSSHPHLFTSSISFFSSYIFISSYLHTLYIIFYIFFFLRYLDIFLSLCFMLYHLLTYIFHYISLRSRAIRRLVVLAIKTSFHLNVEHARVWIRRKRTSAGVQESRSTRRWRTIARRCGIENWQATCRGLPEGQMGLRPFCRPPESATFASQPWRLSMVACRKHSRVTFWLSVASPTPGLQK